LPAITICRTRDESLARTRMSTFLGAVMYNLYNDLHSANLCATHMPITPALSKKGSFRDSLIRVANWCALQTQHQPIYWNVFFFTGVRVKQVLMEDPDFFPTKHDPSIGSVINARTHLSFARHSLPIHFLLPHYCAPQHHP